MDYSLKVNGTFINDIHAGQGYKSNDPYTLGTIINTDGIQPFKSSRVSIWPVYLAFSNLPPEIRMNKDNLVTVVLWVGSKPPMNILLGALQEAIESMSSNGLAIRLPTGTHVFRLCPLFGVFDLIAKAPILNMMQHNGKHGCLSCLHPGQSYNRHWVYLPDKTYAARTHQSVTRAATEAVLCNRVIDGIKGESALGNLIDVVDGVPIDYMHCVLEGVTKRLLGIWEESKVSSAAGIGRSMINDIDRFC